MVDGAQSKADQPHRGRELSRRELFEFLIPRDAFATWGGVALDASRCSACGLCARQCESRALSASGDEALVLTFRGDLCDACGECLRVCPEDCLAPTGPREGGRDKPVVIFRDEPARCSVCGAVIGSKSMIERVRSRLKERDPVLAAKIQLCPSCKGGGGPKPGAVPGGLEPG